MAIPNIFLSDLKTDKCSSVIEARLLRFWEVRNVKRGGELMWVDMLLMDVNVRSLLQPFSRYVYGYVLTVYILSLFRRL